MDAALGAYAGPEPIGHWRRQDLSGKGIAMTSNSGCS